MVDSSENDNFQITDKVINDGKSIYTNISLTIKKIRSIIKIFKNSLVKNDALQEYIYSEKRKN